LTPGKGGTTTNPSNTIYLTTSSDPGTASSWSIYSSGNGVPQATSSSHSGVGLTANNQGLVLSYADKINDDNVLVLKQGAVTSSGWSTSTTTNVASPGATAGGQRQHLLHQRHSRCAAGGDQRHRQPGDHHGLHQPHRHQLWRSQR
jgi:hypothetical protein